MGILKRTVSASAERSRICSKRLPARRARRSPNVAGDGRYRKDVSDDGSSDWQRWWLPRGVEPMLWSGLLPDPADGRYGRFFNRATSLADHDETRCLVLLGDAGAGKSTELAQDRARLQASGGVVLPVDLGACATVGEINDAVFRHPVFTAWSESADDLVVLLDSFDEALVDVVNLADVLARGLAEIDHARLRLRIASRPSGWSSRLEDSLQELWPTSCAVLTLAPLTDRDVRTAAASAFEDGDRFMNELLELSLGPLAARPLTLGLLMRLYDENNALPANRVALFDQAVRLLASEVDGRRQERRRAGPTVEERVTAAESLAVYTMLCSRPIVTVRRDILGRPERIALEDIAEDSADLARLESVVDSALMTGCAPDAYRWSHREFAEYLVARRLSELPAAAAIRLLGHPDAPDRVVSQLAGVASWLAQLNPSYADHVAQVQPQLLLGPTMRTQTETLRRGVGDGLLAQFRRGEPTMERLDYASLTYPGFGDALAAIIADPDVPMWGRIEALLALRSTGIRQHDEMLVSLVEAVIGETDTTSSVVQLGRYALIALEGCTDTELVERLRAVARDSGTPRVVRVDIALAFPADMTNLTDFFALLPDHLLERDDYPERLVADTLKTVLAAATRQQVTTIVEWLAAHPAHAHHSHVYPDAVVDAVAAAAGYLDDQELASKVAHLLLDDDYLFLHRIATSRSDLDQLLPAHRHALARAIIDAASDEQRSMTAWDLRLANIIRTDELGYWLDAYARQVADHDPSAAATAAIIGAIAVPDETAVAVASQAAADHPQIKGLVDELFGDSARQLWQAAQAERAARAAESAQRDRERFFSIDRLDDAVTRNDWPAALREFSRAVDERDHDPAHSPSVASTTAWSQLDPDRRTKCLECACAFLADPPEPGSPIPVGHDAGGAIQLLLDVAAERIDDIDVTVWATWLPHLLRTPGYHDATRAVVGHLAQHDRTAVDDALADVLREQAHDYVVVLHRVGDYASPTIAAVLRELVGDDRTSPNALDDLVEALLDRDPTAADVVMRIVEGRPTPKPPDEADERLRHAWQRAVHAGAAFVRSLALDRVWNALFEEFRRDVDFAKDVITTVGLRPTRGAFTPLEPSQIADLYLWARDALPRPVRREGVTSVDVVAEFADTMLGRLTETHTDEAADQLHRVAQVTHEPWHRALAARATEAAHAATWIPLDPDELTEVLADPRRRAITGEAQLAATIREALDELKHDIETDAAVRRRYWDKQGGDEVRWRPLGENDVSSELSRELRQRIGERVFVGREVEIEPRIGSQAGESIDIFVTVRGDGPPVTCVVEVKGNWNDQVRTAMRTQLAERYLRGPETRTGIYLVAWFAVDGWDPDDYRHGRVRGTRDALQSDLDQLADKLQAEGFAVSPYVLDIALEREP